MRIWRNNKVCCRFGARFSKNIWSRASNPSRRPPKLAWATPEVRGNVIGNRDTLPGSNLDTLDHIFSKGNNKTKYIHLYKTFLQMVKLTGLGKFFQPLWNASSLNHPLIQATDSSYIDLDEIMNQNSIYCHKTDSATYTDLFTGLFQ